MRRRRMEEYCDDAQEPRRSALRKCRGEFQARRAARTFGLSSGGTTAAVDDRICRLVSPNPAALLRTARSAKRDPAKRCRTPRDGGLQRTHRRELGSVGATERRRKSRARRRRAGAAAARDVRGPAALRPGPSRGPAGLTQRRTRAPNDAPAGRQNDAHGEIRREPPRRGLHPNAGARAARKRGSMLPVGRRSRSVAARISRNGPRRARPTRPRADSPMARIAAAPRAPRG